MLWMHGTAATYTESHERESPTVLLWIDETAVTDVGCHEEGSHIVLLWNDGTAARYTKSSGLFLGFLF